MDDAIEIVAEAEHWLAGQEYSVASYQVMRLPEQSNCSAYNCEFVSLAQELDVPLVTADRQIFRAFSDRAISPDGFLTK